jgi:hypothetical protein
VDIEKYKEVEKSNIPKLKLYWTYLNSYRKNVEESKLISSDISNVFTSPLELKDE